MAAGQHSNYQTISNWYHSIEYIVTGPLEVNISINLDISGDYIGELPVVIKFLSGLKLSLFSPKLQYRSYTSNQNMNTRQMILNFATNK